MNPRFKQIILYSTLLITGIVFLFYGLVKARGFLIPFAMATVFSMMLIPVEQWLTRHKFSKGMAVLLADLMLLVLIIGLLYAVGLQLKSISENRAQYEKNLELKIEKLQTFISEKTGISEERANRIISMEGLRKEESPEADGNVLSSFFNFTGKFLLMFVYIFFFMYYRDKFGKGILNFFPEKSRSRAENILENSSRISRQYLFGKLIIVLFLAVVYAGGMLMIGLRHAILVAILSAVLTLIPYIGNIIGVGIAISMSLLTNGSVMTIIWILVLFSVVQFFETYFLEPYIVGHKVNLNPVIIIIVVIIGGIVWGVAGMFLAIPLVGILKVIFENVPVLHPMGYILNEEDTGAEENWIFRLKDRFMRLFRS